MLNISVLIFQMCSLSKLLEYDLLEFEKSVCLHSQHYYACIERSNRAIYFSMFGGKYVQI